LKRNWTRFFTDAIKAGEELEHRKNCRFLLMTNTKPDSLQTGIILVSKNYLMDLKADIRGCKKQDI